MKTYRIIAAALGVLAGIPAGYALREDRIGPDKDQPHPTHAQPGWPHGMVELFRHDARVYSVWVNGNEDVYFQGTPEEVAELVGLFAATRLRNHVLIVKAGKQEITPFNVPKALPYNVHFHVLEGIALAVTRDAREARTHEPTLTIHVDPAGADLLKGIAIPEHLIVQSEIPDWPAKGRTEVPQREVWHAEVRFGNDRPAADFENGVSTKVTFWEEGEEHPVGLGTVGHQGAFQAAFSEREMADLKAGRAWLTLTAGNFLAMPARDDQRLPVGSLARKPEDAKPVVVAVPAPPPTLAPEAP